MNAAPWKRACRATPGTCPGCLYRDARHRQSLFVAGELCHTDTTQSRPFPPAGYRADRHSVGIAVLKALADAKSHK